EAPLVVPPDVLVRSEVVAVTPFGLALVARYGAHVLLAAWMVRARRGLVPDYTPYVATVPTDLAGHPLFFGADARHALRGTAFLAVVEARRARLAEEHAWIRARVPVFADLDAAEWIAARTLVTSRSFACGEGDALAPVADLLNHAGAPVAAWTCDPVAGFRLRIARPVPAGAEITQSYGPKSNARLLLGYGFTLRENPHDDVEIEVGVHGFFRLEAAETAESRRLVATVGGRAAVAAFCRERLAGLPPAEEADGADPGVVSALRVRESERRVLAYWAE
ncbi:MAG: SET domain-containing protein, partial [Myxococcota bacterium]